MKYFLFLVTLGFSVQAADSPSIHNMIVFGKDKLYVSHLPMYEHDVHRYQAVFEVAIPEKVAGKIAGISPKERFTMPSLQKGKRFRAGFHQGHPEQAPSVGNVDVEIKSVVHFHPLKPEGGKRPEKLTYFKVGKSYLVHLLTTPTKGFDTPADQFDQVVELKQAIKPGTLEVVEIPEGAEVTVDKADTFVNRLQVTPDSKNFVRAKVNGQEVMLHIVTENYLHTDGDVRVE